MLARGRYRARLAAGQDDLHAAQRLRHLCFIERHGLPDRPDGREEDGFDRLCGHVLIEETESGRLAGCYRVLPLASGGDIGGSYSAQYYDLAALARWPGPLMELGRFCIHPAIHDADILRVAWGALARLVGESGAELLFGCSSFSGTDPAPHAPSLALLAGAHLAPARWRPGVKAPGALRLGGSHPAAPPDRQGGLRHMPPLLKFYLSLGGWVSDHAVIDPALGTIHVFTGLEIARIPPTRARALRALAQ